MTYFEVNAKYTFEEKLNYFKQLGYDSLHLRTFSYKGFDIITASKYMGGIKFFFYKDSKLIKIRSKCYCADIMHYIKAYIDLELLKKF